MTKHFFLFNSFSLLLFIGIAIGHSSLVEAKTSKKKGHRKSHRTYKVSNQKRKSRHYKHGNGLDLKSITIKSPYTEELNNGINTIETTEPTL